MREEIYSNRYLQGTVLLPLLLAISLTLGIALLSVVVGEILGLVAEWLTGGRFRADIAFWMGAAPAGLLGIGGLIACWAQFFRIVSARSHVMAGLPLLFAEGAAVFSGGRKPERDLASYPPTN